MPLKWMAPEAMMAVSYVISLYLYGLAYIFVYTYARFCSVETHILVFYYQAIPLIFYYCTFPAQVSKGVHDRPLARGSLDYYSCILVVYYSCVGSIFCLLRVNS